MGKFKRGDWVRRTNGTSFSTASGHHGPDFVGQVEEIVSTFGREDLRFTNGHRGIADQYEPWKPKVGDRVRYSDYCVSGVGVVHSAIEDKNVSFDWYVAVDEKDRERAYFFGNTCRQFSATDLEPITTSADATESPVVAPLRIEAGRYYKTRDGRKVGPMVRWSSGVEHPWEQEHGSNLYSVGGDIWRDNGTSEYGMADIIAECVDEPAAQPAVPPTTTASNDNAAPATPKFKVGDRVRVVQEGYVDGGSRHPAKVGDEFVLKKMNSLGTFWRTDGPDFYEHEIEPVATAAIVALIENGTAKPASRPKVHASSELATAEAERLALAHPGQEFGVFVLAGSKIADVVNVPTPVLRAA